MEANNARSGGGGVGGWAKTLLISPMQSNRKANLPASWLKRAAFEPSFHAIWPMMAVIDRPLMDSNHRIRCHCPASTLDGHHPAHASRGLAW